MNFLLTMKISIHTAMKGVQLYLLDERVTRIPVKSHRTTSWSCQRASTSNSTTGALIRWFLFSANFNSADLSVIALLKDGNGQKVMLDRCLFGIRDDCQRPAAGNTMPETGLHSCAIVSSSELISSVETEQSSSHGNQSSSTRSRAPHEL